jgi:hypothetical protein
VLAFRILVRGTSATAKHHQPHVVSVCDFALRASHYQSEVTIRPVLITVNGRPQNVLMRAPLFERLFTEDRSRQITSMDSPPPIYPADLRDTYTYQNVLQRR